MTRGAFVLQNVSLKFESEFVLIVHYTEVIQALCKKEISSVTIMTYLPSVSELYAEVMLK